MHVSDFLPLLKQICSECENDLPECDETEKPELLKSLVTDALTEFLEAKRASREYRKRAA
jgi:hypothetical protein